MGLFKARLVVISVVAASSSAAAQDNVYFGNLHAHTLYSDGSGTPDEAFAAARAAGLHFMAITEHNHAQGGTAGPEGISIATDPSLYNGPEATSLVNSADRHTVAGQFVAIYGQEYSTIDNGNHINVFDIPVPIDIPNKQYRRLLEWTAAHPDSSGRPALMQFNHPSSGTPESREYGRHEFDSPSEWRTMMNAQVSLIELLNGPSHSQTNGHRPNNVQERDYFQYLNLGFRLAPSVGHDNHFRTWGTVTDARIAVIAPELTRRAILDALRARHAYATTDKNLRVVFRSGSALQGDVVRSLPGSGSELPLTLTIDDADESSAAYRVDVFSDVPGDAQIHGQQPANSYEVLGNTSAPILLDGVPFTGTGQYVVVRVRQLPTPDSDQEPDFAWTAPIWFGGVDAAPPAIPPPSAHGTPGGAPIRLTKLLPDPSGPDLRNERVWLRNMSNRPVDLDGWSLVDIAGNAWRLSGRLRAGRERSFARSGQALSLNNGGDELELRNPAGMTVQSVTYGRVSVDQEIPIE